jgi:hypothetical protein
MIKKIKKLSRYDDWGAIIEIIIDKELKPYKKTYQDVIKKPLYKIKGRDVSWFHKFTFNSMKEHTKWIEFGIDFLRTKVRPAFTKLDAENTMRMIDFNYGLKLNFDYKIKVKK